jgi:hypothetical protein
MGRLALQGLERRGREVRRQSMGFGGICLIWGLGSERSSHVFFF